MFNVVRLNQNIWLIGSILEVPEPNHWTVWFKIKWFFLRSLIVYFDNCWIRFGTRFGKQDRWKTIKNFEKMRLSIDTTCVYSTVLCFINIFRWWFKFICHSQDKNIFFITGMYSPVAVSWNILEAFAFYFKNFSGWALECDLSLIGFLPIRNLPHFKFIHIRMYISYNVNVCTIRICTRGELVKMYPMRYMHA